MGKPEKRAEALDFATRMTATHDSRVSGMVILSAISITHTFPTVQPVGKSLDSCTFPRIRPRQPKDPFHGSDAYVPDQSSISTHTFPTKYAVLC